MADSVPAPRSSVAHLDLSRSVPVVVVDLCGWLDVATAPGLEAVLDHALRRRPPRLVVDLTACDSADCFGLGMLERVARRAREDGTELVLTGVNARIVRVLALVGLSEALPVVPDLVRTR